MDLPKNNSVDYIENNRSIVSFGVKSDLVGVFSGMAVTRNAPWQPYTDSPIFVLKPLCNQKTRLPVREAPLV